MAYTKTEWANGATALSADNMNHIETGIKNAHDAIATLDSSVVKQTDVPTLIKLDYYDDFLNEDETPMSMAGNSWKLLQRVLWQYNTKRMISVNGFEIRKTGQEDFPTNLTDVDALYKDLSVTLVTYFVVQSGTYEGCVCVWLKLENKTASTVSIDKIRMHYAYIDSDYLGE